jgi:hypothetical protein
MPFLFIPEESMKKLIVSALCLALFSANGYACDKPAPPSLPDVSTAVLAQMAKAQNDVKSYIAAAEAYLECLGNDNVGDYNATIEEMEGLAESFNSMIADFKARMKKG